MRAAWLVAGLTLAVMAPAHAQLFPDNEARKAILDLRSKVNENDDATRVRLADIVATQNQQNERLNEQLLQLRRALLDLNNGLEALRTDIARLRGSDEQLARDLADLQRRQRDLAQGVDDRLRKVEPTKVALDGKEFLAEVEEKRQYDDAFALLRGADFGRAIDALQAFLRRYPSSGYADSARFWLGSAQFGKREYKDAAATLRAFVTTAPEHPRVPEALLALANAQIELKDVRTARTTLAELLKAHPQSEAAQAGKDRLASLKP